MLRARWTGAGFTYQHAPGVTLTIGDVRRQFGREEPVWGFWFEMLASPPGKWTPAQAEREFYERCAAVAKEVNPLPAWMVELKENLPGVPLDKLPGLR